MSGRGYIAAEKPQQCDDCGKIRECRPYGPNGEVVCYECAKKNPEATERRMLDHILGIPS